jgi:hypothetical protein
MNYLTGSFFLSDDRDKKGYDLYNAYKSDPNAQPINEPPVDYVNEPESTLPLHNTMFAVPDPNAVFVNLLNPVRSL